jgi:hypothetical protein
MYRRVCRSIVALVAVYALALSALLSPLMVTAPATQARWDICSSLDRSGSPAGDEVPIQHGPACPLGGACPAPGCAGDTSVSAGRHATVAFAGGSARIGYVPQRTGPADPPHDFGPQRARAPPAA